MNKCSGCGAVLQSQNKEEIGYVPAQKYNTVHLCERCFRILHYNDLKSVDAYLPQDIINIVNQQGHFAFFLIDLLNINQEVLNTYHKIKIPKCFILSKVDFIPKYINKIKIKDWLKSEYKVTDEIILLSALKNQNIHCIEHIMDKYQVSEGYLIGYTNSGKSTLVNTLKKEAKITTSIAPNTTLDFIKITLENNKTIIDSPGFLYQNNHILQMHKSLMKKILPKNFLKPMTYQLKQGSSILLENILRMELLSDKCNLTIYISNLLQIKKIYAKNNTLKNVENIYLNIDENQDIVIKGIGFITCKSNARFHIYIKNKEFLEIRNSFFGR